MINSASLLHDFMFVPPQKRCGPDLSLTLKNNIQSWWFDCEIQCSPSSQIVLTICNLLINHFCDTSNKASLHCNSEWFCQEMNTFCVTYGTIMKLTYHNSFLTFKTLKIWMVAEFIQNVLKMHFFLNSFIHKNVGTQLIFSEFQITKCDNDNASQVQNYDVIVEL